MINAVIFDMDGVIIDSEEVYQKRMEAYMKYLDAEYTYEDKCLLAGGSSRHYQRFLDERLGYFYSVYQFFDDMDAYCGGEFEDFSSIMFPYIRELLADCKAKGYQVALASSSTPQAIEKVLKSCHLMDAFDFYLSGEMFEESKPNPEIYLTAAKKLGLPCVECAVVEDSTYGIQAAKAAGMFVIARKDDRFGYQQELADVIVEDYRQVPELLENRKG